MAISPDHRSPGVSQINTFDNVQVALDDSQSQAHQSHNQTLRSNLGSDKAISIHQLNPSAARKNLTITLPN